jgi:hypothetical protein
MTTSLRAFHLAKAGPYFAALLLLSFIAFWPGYFSQSPASVSAYTHIHAALATVWVLILIAQPMLFRAGRMSLHRIIGKVSLVVVPLFLVTMVLLAHHKIKGLEGQAYGIQTYILWLQLSLGALFCISYVMAIAKRKNMALHARFMICTGLTLIDPVVVRLMFAVAPVPAFNYQWVTFGLSNLILLFLIYLERNMSRGRRVFPIMLVVFIIFQVPVLFGLTNQAWWQNFAAWFQALPLT